MATWTREQGKRFKALCQDKVKVLDAMRRLHQERPDRKAFYAKEIALAIVAEHAPTKDDYQTIRDWTRTASGWMWATFHSLLVSHWIGMDRTSARYFLSKPTGPTPGG